VRSSYLAVLRLPHARPLLLASLVGRLANATGPLSVVLFVQEQTGSLAQAGAASAAIGLASGLLAPVRGRLVDRYGQRRCLAPMALGFAAALAGLGVAKGDRVAAYLPNVPETVVALLAVASGPMARRRLAGRRARGADRASVG